MNPVLNRLSAFSLSVVFDLCRSTSASCPVRFSTVQQRSLRNIFTSFFCCVCPEISATIHTKSWGTIVLLDSFCTVWSGRFMQKISIFENLKQVTCTGLWHVVCIFFRQRIPRYMLLLRELKGQTPEFHPDHEPLRQAFEKIEQIGSHVNEAKVC